MTGWISLHRQIKDHWIWEDPQKLKWWIDVLLRTNHKDNKTVIGNQVVTIERGTFHTSEVKLAEQWNVSRNTVRSFIKLLESDEMITTKRTRNGTTIKVLNYNDYQTFSRDKKQPTEQQTEQNVAQNTEQKKDSQLNNELHTNNNVNNSNNELITNNNDNNNQSVGVIFDKFSELGFGTINSFTAEQINDHLKTFEPDVITKALEVASNSNKRNLGYANGILKNWKQRNIITLKDVKAAEQQREVEQQSRGGYYQKNLPGESRPAWLDEDKEQKRANIKDMKTVAEDPEFQDMINKFREN